MHMAATLGLTQKQLAERMGVVQPTIAAMASESARNIELQPLLRAAIAMRGQVRMTIEELPEPTTKKTMRKKAA